MKIWKLELTAGERSLAEAKIQRGIFQGDAQSQLLIARIPLNHILRKCTAGYKLSKSQAKINHLMYMDDTKLFAKKTSNTRSENIQSGHRDGIWHRKMCHASYEKRQTTHDTRLERSEERKRTNTWASWKLMPSNK